MTTTGPASERRHGAPPARKAPAGLPSQGRAGSPSNHARRNALRAQKRRKRYIIVRSACSARTGSSASIPRTEYLAELLRRLAVSVLARPGVDAERCPRVGVPKTSLGCLDVDARSDHRRRSQRAQVVEAETFKICPFACQDPDLSSPRRVRPRPAASVDEHQSRRLGARDAMAREDLRSRLPAARQGPPSSLSSGGHRADQSAVASGLLRDTQGRAKSVNRRHASPAHSAQRNPNTAAVHIIGP